MARARFAASAALVLLLVLGLSARGPSNAHPGFEPDRVAAVGWPPSAGFLIAEVVTGGASASDEYVELYNGSGAAADLAGLEVAYVTSSGATVTRKAAWSGSLMVESGRHVMLANGLGVFAGSADGTWSGGLAATGGAIVLRPIGGTPIDAVGWGDAVNAFVEGSAAPAPAASRSIERRPGGNAGNGADTNDNATDFTVNASPMPQGLGGGPVSTPTTTLEPTPAPTPAPTPTLEPTPAPTPTLEPTPAPTPTLEPTPAPTPTLEPTPAPTPTLEPTPPPTPAPTPTLEPTPAPTLEPTPPPTQAPVVPISVARSTPNGSAVVVEGVLTTGLGVLESGLTGFVQDETAGIAVHLDVPLAPPLPAGTLVRLSGTIDERYALVVIRVTGSGVTVGGPGALPAPLETSTGGVAEPLEGRRIALAGTVVEAPTAMADGLGLLLDDGSGPIRVIAGPDALGGADPGTGDRVAVVGPIGQRDSTGTGLAGYRLHATLAGELAIIPAPSPSPTPAPTAPPSPSPDPTASVAPTSTPAPSVTPGPSASPSPSPLATPPATASPNPSLTPPPTAAPMTVSAARAVAPGRQVSVRGVVVAEAGRLGTPVLFAIGDGTGGIVVRLADGQPAPARGTQVEVRGAIADPWGQTEVRLGTGGLSILGPGTPPAATHIDAGGAGEATEGRLVTVSGLITTSASRASSGDIALTITGSDGATLRVMADRSAGLDPAALRKGTEAAFTGVVGQRATRKGAFDGYRLWVRDRSDVAVVTAATPSPSIATSARPTPEAPPLVTIAVARVRDGRSATVEGVLTIDSTLLDASGRRLVIEDTTGAIELYLAAPDADLRTGRVVRVTGTVGRAWGAPRLRVEAVLALGSRTPVPHALSVAPGPATEWRLVRVRGTIEAVHRSGDRWQAELRVGSIRIPITGLPGSGIGAAAIGEGRTATVTGIVKRPFPTATDRRFSILPRRGSDLLLGAAGDTPPSPGPSGSARASGPAAGSSAGSAGAIAGGGSADTADADLADLPGLAGRVVRVGGLVTAVEDGGIRLDDGTATARIVLAGTAADLLPMLRPGDALNATGTVETSEDTVVVVADRDGVVVLGELGAADPTDPAGSASVPWPGDPSVAAARMAAVAARVGSDGGSGPGVAPAVIASLALVVVVGGTAALVCRRRARRLDRARIVARLDAIAAPRMPPAAPAGDVPA